MWQSWNTALNDMVPAWFQICVGRVTAKSIIAIIMLKPIFKLFYIFAKSWNSLPANLHGPMSVQCFKRELKTVIFKIAFEL